MKWFLQGIPLYGGLFRASSKSLKSSGIELFVSTLFSTLPIWFFPLILSLAISGSPTFSTLLLNSIARGDLFIYSTAIAGPLIYVITKRYGERVEPADPDSVKPNHFRQWTIAFPSGASFIWASAGILLIASLLFSFYILPTFAEVKLKLNEGFLFYMSIVVYVFSLSCFYAVTVYKCEMGIDISKEMRDDEKGFLKEYFDR